MSESITRITWYYWSGNTKKKESCYFRSRHAAELCVESLSLERDIFDISFEENLSLSDVANT